MNKEQLKEEAKKEFDYFDDSLLEDGTIANIEICLTKTQSYALKDFVDSQIDKAFEEGRKEMKNEIMKIELCPDEITITQISELENKIQAFGYGQGWMLRKIESIN